MVTRRLTLKLGAAAGAGALLHPALAQVSPPPTNGLMFPEGWVPSWKSNPSPPVIPFTMPLFQMPIARPVPLGQLNPPPDPKAHQRWDDFVPKKYYIQELSEILWEYSDQYPYNQGSWSYGMNGIIPGETFVANYGEPLLIRRINKLPPVGQGHIKFALPSSTIHTHNGHQASESDGFPADFTFPGEFWDHHYPSVYAGCDKLHEGLPSNAPYVGDPREALTTLWYHDHRLDFTAPNTYAGLTGFYLNFDKQDSNNENDTTPGAFRLPSGKYDVPLILHDVAFDKNGQAAWDFVGAVPRVNPEKRGGYDSENTTYTVNGMIGDRFTVNRRIQPFFRVERRKYRLRVLNGGPSRLYSLAFTRDGKTPEPVVIITNDGNFIPAPLTVQDYVDYWPAQRRDVIVDFSKYKNGDKLYLTNRLESRVDGAGQTGRYLQTNDLIMRFDVVGGPVNNDPSRIPEFFREMPPVDLSAVKAEREWKFDYTNGLWTINDKLMDPDRIDAHINKEDAEIWTIRNDGDAWSHPIHTHFEEGIILEFNGKPVLPGDIRYGRHDTYQLGPGDEIKFYGRWRDFIGRYIIHCHNTVHEDHAMMATWKIEDNSTEPVAAVAPAGKTIG
jgi:FtsP/CotA-like multicopper oxidase with cupredoxin domain